MIYSIIWQVLLVSTARVKCSRLPWTKRTWSRMSAALWTTRTWLIRWPPEATCQELTNCLSTNSICSFSKANTPRPLRLPPHHRAVYWGLHRRFRSLLKSQLNRDRRRHFCNTLVFSWIKVSSSHSLTFTPKSFQVLGTQTGST